jgi:toxin ParE1/3/4
VRLRLSRPAARQLDKVLTYIAAHNPQGARHVQERLQAVMDLLLLHPFAGHITARRGIRRILANPYPYAVTYSVGQNEVIVLGIRHTARRPLS